MSHSGDSDPLLAEITRLHAEMSALRRAVQVTEVPRMQRHGWVKVVAKDLETNPDTQYTVHRYGVYYWLVNFPLVALLFFLAPGVWLKWGVFITLQYSIYANLATDYGAMSAAMAARGQSLLPPIPVEPVNGNGIMAGRFTETGADEEPGLPGEQGNRNPGN